MTRLRLTGRTLAVDDRRVRSDEKNPRADGWRQHDENLDESRPDEPDHNGPLPDESSPELLPIVGRLDADRPPSERGRILALDVGSRRIGAAVSDPLGITAQGIDTIQRRNKRTDFEALRQVIAKYQVREIVVGLPLRLSGAEGTQSGKMREFAEELKQRLRLPVHLWDERWTSTQANRLLRETELSIEKRGQAVDRMAAILILQSWMEAHPST
jgi:putative holliday junction resolvase